MSIQQLITPEKHDLGGFSVQRILPSETLKMVGPFIFFDHLGPSIFPAGKGVDVRPHPHINLATVTYLFEGSLLHRDKTSCKSPFHKFIGRARCPSNQKK